MPLPKFMEEAPDLLPGLEVFYDAFKELSGDRSFGFGAIGSIWWSSLDTYAIRNGFTGDDYDYFMEIMHAMDTEYVANLAKKVKAETDKT